MREIRLDKRNEVIRLFFQGYTYDEIIERLDIAKGSVVNIIDEFRDGTLSVPPGLTSHIDELRKLTVDLRKYHLKVAKVESHMRLHARLEEMKINEADIEEWLDMCKYIAQPTVSGEQFVQAALELARLTRSRNGSHEEVIRELESKSKRLDEINDEIEMTDNILQIKRRELEKFQSTVSERSECTLGTIPSNSLKICRLSLAAEQGPCKPYKSG